MQENITTIEKIEGQIEVGISDTDIARTTMATEHLHMDSGYIVIGIDSYLGLIEDYEITLNYFEEQIKKLKKELKIGDNDSSNTND